ncbi:cbb3-type cytochrome oxidase assembly protein CcoS [Pelomonas sp. CA6]|uniref:cbb3-type cytochrome oxidase assembly protein CcoS n=1 Tax=Pelomonas sp. CA6 TaxID=2907999 RepID=UPI001F4C4E39|nr:cbb3-type cytochrome oxidase assembly protein CcoS [Pelomonas sp. CA6]MCH7345736.1 cbb3-type cytochrome oxidase assembly protein CcoS [Pelomonas sp. CA6]
MEVMYVLIPLSVLLVLMILGVLGWAVHTGQLEELDQEGRRILQEEAPLVDGDQAAPLSGH